MMILPPAGTRAYQQIPQGKERIVPSITRQTPPKPAQPKFDTGSILSTAIPVTSLREERVKVCLYGRNRSGKTTLAAQFPKPSLFVSCEPAHCGGVQSIANMTGISFIQVELNPLPGEKIAGSEKMKAIGKELAGIKHFETVVIKTATSLQDISEEEVKKENPGCSWTGKSSIGTYKLRSNKLQEALRPFLDLKHVHLVILAQEKDHSPPVDEKTGFPDLKAKILHTMQQGSFMAPALGGGPCGWIQDACGYVMQIYEDEVTEEISIPTFNPDGTPGVPSVQRVGTGKRQRHLRLKYHPNFAAGPKCEFDPNMPEFVTAPTPAELYAAMAQYIAPLRERR